MKNIAIKVDKVNGKTLTKSTIIQNILNSIKYIYQTSISYGINKTPVIL